MRYKFAVDIAKKANEYVYLATWVSEHDGRLYFELGDRQDYFRHHRKGYEFVGKSQTICVYPSPYAAKVHLNHEIARATAIAYATGDCIRIDVDLRDRT